MNFESLIFDIDGTLWDSRALVAQGYNAQLDREDRSHLHISADQLAEVFGKTTEEIGDILFASLPKLERFGLMERCMASQEVFLERYAGKEIAYPNLLETVTELSKGYRLFIVSNSQCGYPEMCMKKLGLTPYIQGSLCYGQTGTSKGQTILTLMKTHGITSCAYIGDTQKDYEATVEADIPFIWASYGFGIPEHWDFRIDGFEELLNLL